MIPLFTTDQVRAADKYAIEKLRFPSLLLMENAAISIKNAILNEYPNLTEDTTFGIICGKGNNGGDGFALSRHLIVLGYNVIIISLAEESELKGDAKINFEITSALIKNSKNSHLYFYKKKSDLTKIRECNIIIDAVLGTGAVGELKEPLISVIRTVNKFNSIKISIDCPTGLNLINSSGEVIFKANLTITLGELKTGLFYGKGREFAGKIIKGSIGLGDIFFNQLNVSEYLIEPEDALIGIPQKEININKYSAGKVLVIAGSGKMPGASVFTTNAVMNSGAGSCFLAFPNSIKELAQSQMDSAIVFPYNNSSYEFLSKENIAEFNEKINWADVIAIGPGLGRESVTQEAIIEILSKFHAKNIVIDADAIFALRNKNYQKVNLKNKILTPHHKEFSDLLGITVTELNLNLISIGREFVENTQAYLILKGSPTIIFTPKGEVLFNTAGNPGMAKFGTGDVLTGIISSFIAQSGEIENSIISAVYLHSLTADLISEKETEFGLTPQKLIDNFPNTIKFLRDSFV